MTRLDRRQFLGRAARTTAALGAGSQLGLLSGCLGGDGGGTPMPSGKPNWRALAKDLEGDLILPSSSGYTQASRLFNPRFDGIEPQGVAYADDADDVRTAVDWARESGVPIVARNGGHSYGGYSSVEGLVVDLTRVKGIEVDRDPETARIGGGSRLIDVYAGLADHGVTIPAGSCPTVGVSGLTLGGGIGLSGRKLGLTSDNLLEIELVTADGELVVANERDNEDLYWASRGGGGGNFGIATALTFRIHPVDRVAVYQYEWDWRHAAAIFDAWQSSAPDAPDELFSICKLATIPSPGGGGGSPFVSSFGQYFGSRSELESLLEPLTAIAAPTSRTLSDLAFLDAQKLWADCEGSASQCVAQTARAAYKAKSQYVNTAFPPEAVETMVRWIGDWPATSSPNGAAIQMDASGGAINRVPADATAFVHREDLFHCQFLAYWTGSDPRELVDRNLAWIADFYDEIRPFASGHAYQNYIDPDLDGWQDAYYGENYRRLEDVKARYDPHGLFTFRQSIL